VHIVLTLHIYLSTYLFAYFIHSESWETKIPPVRSRDKVPVMDEGTLSLQKLVSCYFNR